MRNEYTYIEAPEIAKLIRADLKVAFPGVKFSVRSSRYSMGSSVSVSWTDGPTTKQVDYAIALYDFCTYDAQEDYHGTADARMINGQLRKGSAHISTSREVSVSVAESVVKTLNWAESYGVRVQAHTDGTASIVADDYSVQRRCWEALSKWTAFPQAADHDEVEPVESDKDAAVRADVELLTAHVGEGLTVSQIAAGQYVVELAGNYQEIARGTVAELLKPDQTAYQLRAGLERMTPDEAAEVLQAAREMAEALAAPAAPVVKPRMRVWSDGSLMLQDPTGTWKPEAARVLN